MPETETPAAPAAPLTRPYDVVYLPTVPGRTAPAKRWPGGPGAWLTADELAVWAYLQQVEAAVTAEAEQRSKAEAEAASLRTQLAAARAEVETLTKAAAARRATLR